MHRKLMALAVSLAYRAGFVQGGLALEVAQADHAKLPEGTRALYKETEAGSGKFRLDVDGVEDTSGLKSALEKERENNRAAKKLQEKAVKDALAAYDGIDPVKYKELIKKMGTDEEQELLKAGNLDEIVKRRTAKLQEDFAKKLQEAESGRHGALEVASTFMERVLDNHVREACMKSGMHASAVDDALRRAREVFVLSDDGTPIQPEDAEADELKPTLGKDGKTPYSLADWAEEMKEKAPHWFPAGASGSGANAGGKGAGGKTIKRAAFEALGTDDKAAKIKEGFKVVD